MILGAEQRNAARKVIEMARCLGYRVVQVRPSSDGKLRIRLARGLPPGPYRFSATREHNATKWFR
jgi:hypothetical protein